MNYPSIHIEGAILSPDILEKIEEAPGQKSADFKLESSIQVKDEIARAWADAQDYWRIFQRKLETQASESPATTETRQQWMIPFLGLLGYELEYQSRGQEINGKIYSISHCVKNRAQIPVQIIGYKEEAGLDRKPERSNIRMSAHAVVQEFLNLNDQLYGIVTNGHVLRLLRDSSRLIKLSYLEFDLDRIFTDGLFTDFAILYRLLHFTRMPETNETAAESWIERYHQESLESGERIRDGLSKTVEYAIRAFGDGFLKANAKLSADAVDGTLKAETYYKYLLRLIYRLLFLMVIEERDLVFPPESSKSKREIYRSYYSVQRLRLLSEKRYLVDSRHQDLWLSLRTTFRLFEASGPGEKLGISPLAGDLFAHDAIGTLAECRLDNGVLLDCLHALSVYEHPENKQSIRVNYGALNVEEFGSVYEGLLELDPEFTPGGSCVTFDLKKGDKRAVTGSHYTPEELVQPLIKNSLDYLIEERKTKAGPKTLPDYSDRAEKALLDLRVADITCGSGHILLAAARRIATEIATIRTEEEQPSPSAYRAALRDVIRNCIYGVDLNPLAVELCKVALWLEGHNPGQPLSFLDHHIKCGNSIVGFVESEELDKGVPDEAFAYMTGDDKEIATALRKRNREGRKKKGQMALELSPEIRRQLDEVLAKWHTLSVLPENTPAEIDEKKYRFVDFAKSPDAWLLNQIAAIPIAQFYLPKTEESLSKAITGEQFRCYWNEGQTPQGQGTAAAWAIAEQKRFFHWFLEFPEIMAQGGFDCILGNPPYLGGTLLSGTYGYPFCNYVKWKYVPCGLSDLVVYFVRRIFSLLKPNGFTAFITTNSIIDGDNRRDGLEQVIAQGGEINMAVRGIRWPGQAKLVVSLVALHKGKWSGKRILDGQNVPIINAFFEDSQDIGSPGLIHENGNRIYKGSDIIGDGFLLSHKEAERLKRQDPRNADVIFPAINGKENNSDPEQKPGRSIINFHDWNMEQAASYPAPFEIVERLVKPERLKQKEMGARKYWWRLHRPCIEMTNVIHSLPRCFVMSRTTKYLNFSAISTSYVFLNALYVFTTDRWDLYSVAQSTLHEVWARKYSGSLKQDLRYSPTNCFENFAFPEGLWQTVNPALANIGEHYHEHRKTLMLSLWLGLTDLYNLFHTPELDSELHKHFNQRAKKPQWIDKVPAEYREAAEAYTYEEAKAAILELRRLDMELDTAVRDAYGWNDLDLDYGFHEIETLPENDRLRYTISPAARKEVLRRLLKLNYARAKEEAASMPTKPKRSKKKAPGNDSDSNSLFPENSR